VVVGRAGPARVDKAEVEAAGLRVKVGDLVEELAERGDKREAKPMPTSR